MSPRTTTLIAACAVLILSACKKDTDERGSEASGLPAQQWLEALSANAGIFEPPSMPRLPDDFYTHPDTQAETFLLQAILRPGNSSSDSHENSLIGIIAQIDRLTVSSGDHDFPTQSQWQFGEVLRSVVMSDVAADDTALSQRMSTYVKASAQPDTNLPSDPVENLATSARTQHVQRASLGLAGSEQSAVWVLGNRMAYKVRKNTAYPCSRRYLWELVLTATEQADLSVEFDGCPQPDALGEFNNWQQTSATISGVLTSSAEDGSTTTLDVSGFAWMSHAWGNLPTSSGAVVFDTMQLQLDGDIWLDVSRSKRRSGSGPKTVSATLRSESAQSGNTTLAWRDGEELATVDSGNRYPRSINLENDERSMVLSITPLNRFDEIVESGEHRIQVPVTVEGTHSGSGFLTYTYIDN